MKRRLVTITVFLLAGAVVNVAVAWGCSVRGQLRDGGQYRGREAVTRDQRDWWQDRAPSRLSTLTPVEVSLMGIGAVGYEFVTIRSQPASRGVAHRFRSGWPMFSLERASWFSWESGVNESHGSMHLFTTQVQQRAMHGGSTGAMVDYRVLVPSTPIWRGFAVNTLFYATILWLVIPGPFVLRRYLRVRRGLCPTCAYPMGTTDVCTECGVTLHRLANAGD